MKRDHRVRALRRSGCRRSTAAPTWAAWPWRSSPRRSPGACAATATQYLDQPLGGLPILLAGSEAQKKKYLPRLATGELLSAYSLSEPGAGSDAAGAPDDGRAQGRPLRAQRLQAVVHQRRPRRRHHASSRPSIPRSAPRASPPSWSRRARPASRSARRSGSSASAPRPRWRCTSPTARCPSAQRLGAEGEGFKIAMSTLDITRPATGAMAVGIAQAALDAAVGYAQGAAAVRPADRRLPGHPVHAGRHGDADPRRAG